MTQQSTIKYLKQLVFFVQQKFILQPWENTCICGRSISDGGTYLRDPWIVSIYEEFEYQKARFPLCLGALISHHHVLTSKMCFGRLEIENGNGLSISFQIQNREWQIFRDRCLDVRKFVL